MKQVARLQERVRQLQLRVRKLRPAENPPLLVIEFNCEVNRNAPKGTKASVTDGDGRPNRFVMVPKGFVGSLPEGIPIFDWQKGDDQ